MLRALCGEKTFAAVDEVKLSTRPPGGAPDTGDLARLTDLRDLTLIGDEFKDADLKPLQKLERLKQLGLVSTAFSPEDLRSLSDCPALESLFLSNENVTDAHLEAVAACKKLRGLVIFGKEVTDRGLAKLQDLPLTTLHLNDVPMTDGVLRTVSRFTKLKRLHLGATRPKGFRDLDGGDGLAALVDLPELQWLSFTGSNFDSKGLRTLARCPALRRLGFWITPPQYYLDAKEVAAFRSACPKCDLRIPE